MGWNDRDYNAGREEMNAYFANPGLLMQYTLPLYMSSTLHIRLSFWFLLSAIFLCVDDLRGAGAGYIPLDVALMLGICLWHELGHRVFARMVGGNHWEWILWPIGGMIAPNVPRTPKATFVGNVGGLVFSIALFAGSIAGAYYLSGAALRPEYLWGMPVGLVGYKAATLALNILFHSFGTIVLLSVYMILMNLYPCYWFDGAHIWQSILWPFIGQWRSMRWVCLAGMILAVPLLVMSLMGGNFFGLILWALIFADCFRRRQALAAAGPDSMDEDVSYNYMDTPEPRRKKLKKSWFRNARKRAERDQAEQAKIDAILAKVSEHGIHSLSWWEKRALHKATERQRKQDMAGRL